MKAGAVDFLRKPLDSADLLRAITKAVERDIRARRLHNERMELAVRFGRLTRREREVMVRVIAGKLNKQIAAELGTVEKTIKVHRGRVMQKLGVRTMVDLLRLADRAGVTPIANRMSPTSPLGRVDEVLE
jgi:FixJ family two-component response regulator